MLVSKCSPLEEIFFSSVFLDFILLSSTLRQLNSRLALAAFRSPLPSLVPSSASKCSQIPLTLEATSLLSVDMLTGTLSSMNNEILIDGTAASAAAIVDKWPPSPPSTTCSIEQRYPSRSRSRNLSSINLRIP